MDFCFQKNSDIALAPIFIDGFYCNFTQMLGMIISQASGPWFKVMVTVAIFRKKLCHRSRAYIYQWILI